MAYCYECDAAIESPDPNEWLCPTCKAEANRRATDATVRRSATAEVTARIVAAKATLPTPFTVEYVPAGFEKRAPYGRLYRAVHDIHPDMVVDGFRFRVRTGDEGRPTGPFGPDGWELVPEVEVDGDALRPKWHRD